MSLNIRNGKASYVEMWGRDFQREGTVSLNVWSREAQQVHEAGRKTE